MCRSLFCKPLEHTDSFPSSGNLLPNSVFGPTLVLSISPQFPETLAGRLLWLEPMRASFVRRMFTAKAIKAAIRDTGLKPRTAVTGIALASQAERFPPPLQFCLPHLAPFQGAQQQCPARGLQLPLPGWGGGWQRTKLWLILTLGGMFGPWVDTETSYKARKRILQSNPNVESPNLYSNLSSIFLLWSWNICIRKRNWKEMNLEKRGE